VLFRSSASVNGGALLGIAMEALSNLFKGCCAERKEGVPGKRLTVTAGRQSVHSFSEKKQKGATLAYTSSGPDSDKFDRALQNQDLKMFVELLPSAQKIDAFQEKGMHPWAEDPTTMGALAGTQLAILASMAERDHPDIKDDIRKVGAIKPLVEFLRSNESDRVQAAVVALSFLTADCSANAEATQKAGAMSALLKCAESPIGGMRAAASTTLRNICMESEAYRREFFELGGMRVLVKQLTTKPDDKLKHTDVLLEAVLNLQDMIEREDGNIYEDFAQAAIAEGAIVELEKLLKVQDEEVRTSAEEVLEVLKGLNET